MTVGIVRRDALFENALGHGKTPCRLGDASGKIQYVHATVVAGLSVSPVLTLTIRLTGSRDYLRYLTGRVSCDHKLC